MKKNKLLIKILIQLLIMMMILSTGVSAYAAPGGGKPAPAPVVPVITPASLSLQTDAGATIEFSLTAKSKNADLLVWSATPDGLTKVRTVINAKKTAATVTYSFTSNQAITHYFSITATLGTLVSAPAAVDITVKGIVPPPTELNYLVLGDSIAAGTDNESIRNAIIKQIEINSSIFSFLSAVQDLTANPENYLIGKDYRYTYQFRDYLQATTGLTINMTDLAVGGYTTADLLAQVQGQTEVITAADVISISIGGNDILTAGAASGFSEIDASQFNSISTTVRSNLDATLTFIREKNPNAKIILMNFLNLYNPYEMSSDNSYNLYDKAGSFLNPLNSAIGNIFKDMQAEHKLIMADTYSLFETINHGASNYSTTGTYAARSPINNPPYIMDPITTFPARFITSSVPVKSPFLAWSDYQAEWGRLEAANFIVKNFVPISSGVTIDLYTHFYNPTHYVFGQDESSSDLINMVKAKYGALAWLFFGGTVLDSIEPFEAWRDVHCTALGHSLIAKAHIDAWENQVP